MSGLKLIVGCFVEVCRRRGLKVIADKSKVMVLGGEEGLEWMLFNWNKCQNSIFGMCFG